VTDPGFIAGGGGRVHRVHGSGTRRGFGLRVFSSPQGASDSKHWDSLKKQNTKQAKNIASNASVLPIDLWQQ
jgi:hypothetical protein